MHGAIFILSVKNICGSRAVLLGGKRVQLALWALKAAEPWARGAPETIHTHTNMTAYTAALLKEWKKNTQTPNPGICRSALEFHPSTGSFFLAKEKANGRAADLLFSKGNNFIIMKYSPAVVTVLCDSSGTEPSKRSPHRSWGGETTKVIGAF